MLESHERERAARAMAELSEAEGLIDRLHAAQETHTSLLIRKIHDELGGLMVSAAMDLTSVRQRLPGLELPVLEQLDRVQNSLESAIDLSRRMVEELRPSILDNFGLFAAVKWHLRQVSVGSEAHLTERYPASEPSLEPGALTALFRVAQEAIGMIFKRQSVRSADINLKVENGAITMRFADDGIPQMVDGVEMGAADSMTSMKHRFRALGGTVELIRTTAGTTELTAHLPLASKAGSTN